MFITKRQYEDYQRLKRLEQTGHILTVDGMRLIVRECEYDPEKVGKHFLAVYAKWKHNYN